MKKTSKKPFYRKSWLLIITIALVISGLAVRFLYGLYYDSIKNNDLNQEINGNGISSDSPKNTDVEKDKNISNISLEFADKIISKYYNNGNSSQSGQLYSYTYSSWQSGAILKKDISLYRDDQGNISIGEPYQKANVNIDLFNERVIEGSIFYYYGTLSRNLDSADEAYLNEPSMKIDGFLKLSDNTVKRISISAYNGSEINFYTDIDTDLLPNGDNYLCIYTEPQESFSYGGCLKLIRANGPIQEDIYVRGNDNPPPHFISKDGYYVLIDGIKYNYVDKNYIAEVRSYKYSENKEYLLLDVGHWEGGSVLVYRLNANQPIEGLKIDWDSIWKKTDSGYRVYVCSAGGYSQEVVKYYDINSSNDSVKENIISESGFLTCDFKNRDIRIIESVAGDNKVQYFKYSMDTDIISDEKIFNVEDPNNYYDTGSEEIDNILNK